MGFGGLGAALLQINLCQFGELGTALPRIGSVGGPGASFKKSPGGVIHGPIPTTVGNTSTEHDCRQGCGVDSGAGCDAGCRGSTADPVRRYNTRLRTLAFSLYRR